MTRRLVLGSLTLALGVSAFAVPVWINLSYVRSDAATIATEATVEAASIDPAVPVARAPKRATRTARAAPQAPAPVPPKIGKGVSFAWPVVGAITSPFGPRGEGFHHGMDIDCVPTHAIGASLPGLVRYAGEAPVYGNVVLLEHANGYSTLYAHLSKLWVVPGDTVRHRQALGLCGSTGRSTGSHLHFEVRAGGYVWDPLRFLAA